VEEQEYYRLSFSQNRIWKYQQANPNGNSYNIFERIPFYREMSVEGVRHSLGCLIQRHHGLRTHFTEIDRQPVQRIQSHADIPLEVVDLTGQDTAKPEEAAQKLYRDYIVKPFDLRHAPLFRAALVKMDTEYWQFILVVHHIITDGWSQELLKGEFMAFYNTFLEGAALDLEPLKLQYRDYTVWQNRQIDSADSQAEVRAFWHQRLEGGLTELSLPYDFEADENDVRGMTYRCVIDTATKKGLRKLSETHSTSLFLVLFSAYNVLISRFSGESDILCRIPAAGRIEPDLQPVMGYFVNHIVAKNHVTEDQDFRALLDRVTRDTLELFKHQWYPFEKVLEELGLPVPTINVTFNMLSMMEAQSQQDINDWEPYLADDVTTAKFPLVLRGIEYRDGVELLWHFKKALFKPETIKGLARDFLELLTSITGENH